MIVVQPTNINKKKVITEEVGFPHSAVYKNTDGKLSGRKKCMGNLKMIMKQSPFKNFPFPLLKMLMSDISRTWYLPMLLRFSVPCLLIMTTPNLVRKLA